MYPKCGALLSDPGEGSRIGIAIAASKSTFLGPNLELRSRKVINSHLQTEALKKQPTEWTEV